MVLGLTLKVILLLATGTAVAVPVSYLVVRGALGAFEEVTYVKGERCLHFPIKSGERDKKVFVCKQKSKEKPVFKWWTRDGSRENEMQEIETLSWNKKSVVADSTGYLNFELKGTLKQGAPEPRTIQEDGSDNYIAQETITQLGKNCIFKSISNKQFVLLCKESDAIDAKKHEIPVNFYG